MENENTSIEQIRENKLKVLKSAIDDCVHFTDRLSQQYSKLADNSEKLISQYHKYRTKGENDKKLNSTLWHELNNIVHVMQQMAKFNVDGSEDMSKEFKTFAEDSKIIMKEVVELGDELTAIRPPKDPPAE